MTEEGKKRFHLPWWAHLFGAVATTALGAIGNQQYTAYLSQPHHVDRQHPAILDVRVSELEKKFDKIDEKLEKILDRLPRRTEYSSESSSLQKNQGG